MWEAIQANVRRSRLLIGLMGGLLVLLGFLVGEVWSGGGGGPLGAVAALGVWLVMLATALLGGDRLILAGAGARQIRKQDAPKLWNVVEEMTIASGLGKIPRIYIIDDPRPNAFATGRKPEEASVAVTSGLLKLLNRDELQGVVAHEIGHIKNLDIRFLTIAAVMLGGIVLISDLFLRSLWFGGGGRRRSSGGGGQAQLIILVATILVAVLGPLAAQMLYFAVSRKREYLADASAARFTRYPAGLASALQKIAGHQGKSTQGVLRAVAPMYIINPLQAASGTVGLFSTHPPTAERIRILRAMGAAGWEDYETAYKSVVGGTTGVIDRRTLTSEGSVAARQATVEPETKERAVERARQVTDLLDRFAGLLLVACPCGVRIKIPPDLKRDQVGCPRCGREHEVPHAEATDAEADPQAGPLRYRRQGDGWESFKCACGTTQELSPAFDGASKTCGRCRRKIEIVQRPG